MGHGDEAIKILSLELQHAQTMPSAQITHLVEWVQSSQTCTGHSYGGCSPCQGPAEGGDNTRREEGRGGREVVAKLNGTRQEEGQGQAGRERRIKTQD